MNGFKILLFATVACVFSSLAQASFDPKSLDLTKLDAHCGPNPCYLDKTVLEVNNVAYFSYRFYKNDDSDAMAMVKFDLQKNQVIWLSEFTSWSWDGGASHVIDSLALSADQSQVVGVMTITTEDDYVRHINFGLNVSDGAGAK